MNVCIPNYLLVSKCNPQVLTREITHANKNTEGTGASVVCMGTLHQWRVRMYRGESNLLLFQKPTSKPQSQLNERSHSVHLTCTI